MGIGGRRDDDAVDARGEQRVGVGDRGRLADPAGDGLDGRGDRVGDDELVDVVEPGEGVGVEGADAPEADESDAHLSPALR